MFGTNRPNRYSFKIGELHIETVTKYKYLGVFFSSSGSFLNAKVHLVEQAKKAMHLLYKRIFNLDLPIDLQLQLFDHTIVPILTYSAEVWGYENTKIIEQVHLSFLRKITKTRMSTPAYMLYGETGRYPLNIIIKSKMIQFWTTLLRGKESKIFPYFYLAMFNDSSRNFKWTNYVKSVLDNTGFSYIWLQQSSHVNPKLHKCIKQVLIDQFIQVWHSEKNNSNKGKNYAIYKETLELEKYFLSLPTSFRLHLSKFRMANHKFPVETGRYNNTEYAERYCQKCNSDIGDEFHYLLVCPFYNTLRKKYLSPYYFARPNVIKYKELLNTDDPSVTTKLAIFVKYLVNNVVAT